MEHEEKRAARCRAKSQLSIAKLSSLHISSRHGFTYAREHITVTRVDYSGERRGRIEGHSAS